ncbi:MAG: D-2-hydroxyacid dehydrogenase [Pelosinus sp.]|nr:D-2-hydroxyacid dehydrogenase [Pelosinus sp.]
MSALKIVALNSLADRHKETITKAYSGCSIITCKEDELSAHIKDADILVCWGSSDIRAAFPSAAKLQWIQTLSAGVEGLLFPELVASDIILTNAKGIHGIPISEHVFAMILTFTRGLHLLLRQQAEKRWKRVPTEEIYDKTMGIIGLGSIGREIAKKAKGLGMQVMATKQEMTKELFVDKLYHADELLTMLPECDFVVAALPLLPSTKNLIMLKHFTAMKSTAYFINIARGGIVNEPDLITALQEGFIKGAGLDVFAEEPLAEASPLWNMPNVIITPHIAGLSPSYLDRAISVFASNLTRFVNQTAMFNVVDKQKGY